MLTVAREGIENILGEITDDMTMDELKANAGEPEADNYSHYEGDNGYYTDTFKYTRPSTKYYGNSSFSFDFTKGELNYIYITYMP